MRGTVKTRTDQNVDIADNCFLRLTDRRLTPFFELLQGFFFNLVFYFIVFQHLSETVFLFRPVAGGGAGGLDPPSPEFFEAEKHYN